jgi:hypothetical protein
VDRVYSAQGQSRSVVKSAKRLPEYMTKRLSVLQEGLVP